MAHPQDKCNEAVGEMNDCIYVRRSCGLLGLPRSRAGLSQVHTSYRGRSSAVRKLLGQRQIQPRRGEQDAPAEIAERDATPRRR